ncbi:hypothetical protein D0907_18380 (plasmid) [Pseudoalteromonas lipolytica]|uniref:Uncharacterized protein n=1 Tax=Pseudoalteromonas lipolytica TaxID=570156 RepID=A0AAD0WEA9_9GAMM|nr:MULTISPECIES: hypothetical protein [Pseudoalteromonas]AXV67283.1 hypothetical protein D0907_18380 [Pseudoalteromonas donghaensis]EWH05577.1 hypothetical protein AT00_15235 [Pseudoalteromonas lipolytica SCSIO 04301]MBE0352604.1 hypothetical protein [Pseudoalteromonas lipolytica LMEB 39]MCC9662754.1 hypothetical protein [Pseudoalteromonas sp. MB41]QLJ10314.1 hypothetical protein GZH31_16490 [Pseudoalteromonas sp. JSTW]
MIQQQHSLQGFGDSAFNVAVYIEKRPPMVPWHNIDHLHAMQIGQIDDINQACGNGWRKVFNVYAKVLFALPSEYFQFAKCSANWQTYRDTRLLQAHSHTALLFSPPVFDNTDKLHIIAGRTYAKSLVQLGLLSSQLTWLDEEFAFNKQDKVIVCPYFDYRQLSNIKIARLSQLVADIFA